MTFRRLRTLSALLLACLMGRLAWADGCSLRRITAVPYREAANGLMLVPVTLNNRQTTLVFDTGTYFGLLRPSLAEGLDIRPLRVLDRRRTAGTPDFVTVPLLQIGTVIFEKPEFVVAPDTFSNLDVAGNLDSDVLWGADIEIDPRAQMIRLYERQHCPGQVVYWPHGDLAKVPFTLIGLTQLAIPVTLDGKAFRALIDTSVSTSQINLAAARAQFALVPGGDGVEAIGDGITREGKKFPTYRHPHESPHFLVGKRLPIDSGTGLG